MKNNFVDLSYTLDTLGTTLGNYEFARIPACDYAETINVLGIPQLSDVITHDIDAKTLSLAQTNNPAYLGNYAITVQSSFD